MYPTTAEAPLVHHQDKSGLAELFEVILDRGLVVDAYVRVSLIGIELLTIDARVVVASVDTYLHFAEAVNRLDLRATSTAWNLTDLGSLGDDLAEGGIEAIREQVGDAIPLVDSDDDSDDGDDDS